MPFADTQDYIDRAILHAGAGVPAGENPVLGQDVFAEVLVANALHALAHRVAIDPHRRHLLQKRTTVVLTNGVGVLDDSLMTEFIESGSVRDGDLAQNQENGNLLARVQHYNDFLGFTRAMVGYYCLHNNQIHTKAIGSGSLLDTQSPLTVDCSYVPTPTEVPAEIEDDAVEILSLMLQKQPVNEE